MIAKPGLNRVLITLHPKEIQDNLISLCWSLRGLCTELVSLACNSIDLSGNLSKALFGLVMR